MGFLRKKKTCILLECLWGKVFLHMPLGYLWFVQKDWEPILTENWGQNIEGVAY